MTENLGLITFMATYPEIYNSFPNIEKFLSERLPPETFANFQSWHETYGKATFYENNEFDFLKSIRRFFMRTFESTNEVSSLKIGLTIFEALFQQNAADRSYILIHTAYLCEHLGQSEKADECIKMALDLSTNNTLVILGKIGKFYCYHAKNQFKNPMERATSVFETLRDLPNYKEIIDQQLKNIYQQLTYLEYLEISNRLKTLTGNNPESFALKIMSSPDILSSLRDLIYEIRPLVEASQLTVEATYLDKVIRKSMATSSKEFRKKGELDLSNKCTLLRINCSEIISISKGDTDSNNFTNYCDMADDLNAAKEQKLNLLPEAQPYYKQYEEYIEKAITLGEKAIISLEYQDKNFPKFCSSLADAYRLRGNFRTEKGNKKIAFDDLRRSLQLFRSMGNIIYEESYLDWDVDRLAKCYFKLGEFNNALNEYRILFDKSNTKKYQAALALGDVYDKMKDFLNAKAWYLECIKINDNPAAYDKLIHLHKNYGNYDDAIEWVQRLIRLESIQSSKRSLDYGYFRLGILYEEKGDTEKAIETFRYIVTNRQPDSVISLSRLISLLITSGKNEDVLKWLMQYEAVIGNIPLQHLRIYHYCTLGDWYLSFADKARAFEYYKKTLDINPETLVGLQRLAKWYVLNSESGNAIEIVKNIIGIIGEENANGYYKWIGDLYWQLKDKTNALDAYNNCLEIKPSQPEVYDRIESITGKPVVKERFIEQTNEFEEQYQNSPSPELATKIVNCSLDCRDSEYAKKALIFLKQSIYQEGTFDYYDKLASIHETRKDYRSAIDVRSQIDELESLDPQVRIKNLRCASVLIDKNKLYRYKSYELTCIRKIEDLIRNTISVLDEGFTGDTDLDIDETERNIYAFRDEIELLAKYYLKNGYYAKAHQYIRHFIKSKKYELQSDKVYLQTEAEIFFAEERFDAAGRVAQTIVNLEGEDSHALFLLGRICGRKKEYSDAIEYFQRSYNASDGRIDALDQISAMYREWTKKSTLTKSEKTEIKQKAIACSKSLCEKQPFDKIALYGLAKSYLLETPTWDDILSAKDTLLKILRSQINTKSHITQEDIDNKAIAGLLYLWAKHKELTIKKILINKHYAFESLDRSSDALFKRAIINIACEENYFEQHIINTLQQMFIENRHVGIGKAICRYLMKHLIYRCYKSTDIQEIQRRVKEIIELILGSNQYEATTYLAEFLGSERGAYLEYLTEVIDPEMNKIHDSIWKLNEENPDNITEIAVQWRDNIKFIKDKLRAFELFSFNLKSINIKETLVDKEKYYHGRAGKHVEFTIDMSTLKDIRMPVSAWEKVDDFIFDSLDSIKASSLICSYSLMVGQNGQILFLLISGKFPDAHEDWGNITSTIKNASCKLKHKNFKADFSYLSDGFYTWIIFEGQAGDRTMSSAPFTKLLDFLTSTYALPVSHDYWGMVYSLTRSEINLNHSKIKEDILDHVLSQLSELFSNAKNHINLFLEVPHDLDKLCNNAVYPLAPGERKLRILKVKNAFRNISFLKKNILYPDTETTFDLRDVISVVINEFVLIPLRQGIEVKFEFKTETGDAFPFTGSRERVEAIIRNLFHNAYKSMNKKFEESPDSFNPAIRLSLCTNDGAYEILFSDNGEGIPEGTELTDLLKESNQKSGTGIGLNIIATLVNRYKGKFDVFSSKTGEGSHANFIIKLPLPG